MIWLTWRQYRVEALIGAAAFALAAAVLLVTGLNMASDFEHTGVAACLAGQGQNLSCGGIERSFQNQFQSLDGFVVFLYFLPLLIGLLLAAPFAQEWEQGTYRMVWSQSVGRTRWLVTRLGLTVGVALLTSLALVLVMTWWRGPLDQLNGRFSQGFDFEGTVPIAYTLFVLALGVAAGAVLRRTVPAIGVTITGFLALRAAVVLLRPHYEAPVLRRWPLAAEPRVPTQSTNWVLNDGYMDRLGHQVNDVLSICSSTLPKAAMTSCLQEHGISYFRLYQPAGRFWLFQGIESAIFLVPAVILLGIAFWWVRYRVT